MITLDEITAGLHSIKVSDGTNDLLIDGSGHLSINDGGNSITVDGTVAATQSGTWNIGTVASITADVSIDDGGNVISIDDAGGSITVDGTVSIGAQAFVYAEDSAHTTADEGAFMLAVRADSKASTAGTDGDYAALIQDADGDLYVSDTVAQGSLATIAGDTTSIDGKLAALGQGVMAGSMPVVIASDQSVISIDDNGGSLTVDGSVSVSSMPGIYVEDAASAGGENLMLVGGYRQDANTSPVSADGDFHGFIFNNAGELKVSSRLDDVANTSVIVTTVTVDTTVGGVQLVASALTGRRDYTVQNLGNQAIWLKNGTGTTSGAGGNGFKLPAGSSVTKKWGDTIDLYGITASSTASIKVIEAS